MGGQTQLDEYMTEIREQVCRRCAERPADAPPCGPKGKPCGIELHLEEIVKVCHEARGKAIDPYLERFHEEVCGHCENQATYQCPCPLDYMLLLAIESIKMVDQRRAGGKPEVTVD